MKQQHKGPTTDRTRAVEAVVAEEVKEEARVAVAVAPMEAGRRENEGEAAEEEKEGKKNEAAKAAVPAEAGRRALGVVRVLAVAARRKGTVKTTAVALAVAITTTTKALIAARAKATMTLAARV